MRSYRSLVLLLVTSTLIVNLPPRHTTAQDKKAATKPTEPLGGQPAPGSQPSVKDLDYQVKYHRAFEAVL